MPFTFFDILTWALIYLQYFVVAKIIIRDKTLHLKEGVYIAVVSLFMAMLAVVSIGVINLSGTINGIALPVLCMIYFHKIKSYSFKKAVALIFLPIFIIAANDTIMMTATNAVFPYFLYYIPNFPLPIRLSLDHFLQFVPYLLLTYTFSALTALFLVKITEKPRDLINRSNQAQTVWVCISLLCITINIIISNFWRYLGAIPEFLLWTSIPLFGITASSLISVILYAKFLREQMALQQKETEQEALQYYTREVDEYQAHMSRILHDVENIISSMEGYLDKDDFVGAKAYFYHKIKPETAVITGNNNALARLANIKIPEVRAIIVRKLREAQAVGVDITVEVTDEIAHIPVDSIALVRMLGIILDNAVEELATLDEGKLMIAVFRKEDGVNLVVQNTCRVDIPKLYELKQPGYSTKGKGRGIGLNNLKEIVAVHPNISIWTDIEDGNFTQKLRIGGGTKS